MKHKHADGSPCKADKHIVITIGKATYRLTDCPDNIAEFKRVLSAKHIPGIGETRSGAEIYKAAYRNQTRTQATPAEYKRVMAELTASGDYQEYHMEQNEPEVSDYSHYDWYNLIPSFTERIAA